MQQDKGFYGSQFKTRWGLYTAIAGGLTLSVCGCGGGSTGPSTPGAAAARVVFQSELNGVTQIFLMNGDGTGQVALTNSAEPSRQPAFNRDGSLIAFQSRRSGDASDEIYVMDSDGQNERAITSNGFNDAQPTFSPRDNTLVFKSTRNGQTDLYSLNIATGVEKQLTNDQAFDNDPAFTADGRVIFSSNGTGLFLLYVLENGKARELPHETAESQFFPDVRRDGLITFVSNRDGNFEIYVMNQDGSGRRRLTNNSIADVDPVFSPDGSRIYYSSLPQGNYDIYEMNTDGEGQPRRRTTLAGADRLPDVR